MQTYYAFAGRLEFLSPEFWWLIFGQIFQLEKNSRESWISVDKNLLPFGTARVYLSGFVNKTIAFHLLSYFDNKKALGRFLPF